MDKSNTYKQDRTKGAVPAVSSLEAQDIRMLEEAALNAWPSLQSVFMDGWVLRFANGYTRRANSVISLYPSSLPLKRKIEACEALYAKKGLKSVFRIVPVSMPAELDAVLAGAGYGREGRTSVQTLNLDQWVQSRDKGVELYKDFVADWHPAYCMMNGIAPVHHDTVRTLLEKGVYDQRLAVLRRAGEVVACGLGIRQDRFLGLFSIVVNPRMRLQGHGKAIVEGLLSWAKQEGAKTAYLQVVTENMPALKLYEALGFKEAYQSWYRVRPM